MKRSHIMALAAAAPLLCLCNTVWAQEVGPEADESAPVSWALEVKPAANITQGDHRGWQVAAATNIIGGDATSVQLSGLTNVVSGDLRGAQLAWATNVTTGSLNGAQVAMVNVASGVDKGAMVGAVNVVRQGTRGFQMGVVNVSGERVRGLQLGLINVAPTSTASLGFFNLFWRGETMMDVSTSELGQLSVGVRHGSGAAFNTYFVGYMPGFGSRRDAALIGLGRGWRFALGQSTQLEIDLTAQVFLNSTSRVRGDGVTQMQTLRLLTEWRASQDFALYAGPSLRVFHSPVEQAREYLGAYRPWTLRSGEDGARAVAMWAGLTAGVRLF